MIGAGLQPVGTFAGLGAVELAPLPPVVVSGPRYLNDTGKLQVDPLTRDIQRMRTMSHRVLLAIRTAYGSAGSDPTLGVAWPPEIDANADARIRGAVESALTFLTSAKQIEVLGIDWAMDSIQGRVRVSVDFRDLTTNSTETIGTLI